MSISMCVTSELFSIIKWWIKLSMFSHFTIPITGVPEYWVILLCISFNERRKYSLQQGQNENKMMEFLTLITLCIINSGKFHFLNCKISEYTYTTEPSWVLYGVEDSHKEKHAMYSCNLD